MTYAYDTEIAPRLEILPNGPYLDVRAPQPPSGQAVQGGLPSYEPAIASRTRRLAGPGPYGSPDGSPDVTVRVYAPAERDGLLYIHGVAFTLGGIERSDATTTRIAAEVDAVVISVEYRLAPENPLPAGLEDRYAAVALTAMPASRANVA